MSGNNKTKKILFIILAIVVIVVLGLVVYQYSGYKAGTKVQKGVGTEEGKTGEGAEESVQTPEKIVEITNEAIQARDISICGKIKDEKSKKACRNSIIMAKAAEVGDLTICDQLEKEDLKAICEDNMVFKRALGNKDPNLCEEMIDKARIGLYKDLAARE